MSKVNWSTFFSGLGGLLFVIVFWGGGDRWIAAKTEEVKQQARRVQLENDRLEIENEKLKARKES